MIKTIKSTSKYNERIWVQGRVITKYNIPQKHIDDLNNLYERSKKDFVSHGKVLAGRIRHGAELEILPIIQKSTIFKVIMQCMNEHMNTLIDFDLVEKRPHNFHVLSCWVNDMKEREYNPVHTHHDNTGYSVVLFLKMPKFINDTPHKHKFNDGKLCFIDNCNVGTWNTESKEGDFYIFNADHQHTVYPFKTDPPGQIRRTMSFNYTAEPKDKK